MMTELQYAVLDEVESRLSSVEGYDGVWFNYMPTDDIIAEMGFQKVVEKLITLTVSSDHLTLPVNDNDLNNA
jgi:hypothetical protein